MNRLRSFCLMMLLAICLEAMPQGVRPLRVLSWNVENLFDCLDDAGFDDSEYLPKSVRRWTPKRFKRKLVDIARIIAAVADDGGEADLIGLCEVENDNAVKSLVGGPLASMKYKYVMTHSADRRGVDVALLWHPSRFRLLNHTSFRVPSVQHGFKPTRDILYASGIFHTDERCDTIHVFVCHLPSRLGGGTANEHRRLAASVLWTAIDSVRAASAAEPRIILMGDFNASMRDPIFKSAPLRSTDDKHADGTYSYRGNWEWIDHILISDAFAHDALARPIRYKWLLRHNKTYGTDLPYRTYSGTTYIGGTSDHLPILIDLK